MREPCAALVTGESVARQSIVHRSATARAQEELRRLAATVGVVGCDARDPGLFDDPPREDHRQSNPDADVRHLERHRPGGDDDGIGPVVDRLEDAAAAGGLLARRGDDEADFPVGQFLRQHFKEEDVERVGHVARHQCHGAGALLREAARESRRAIAERVRSEADPLAGLRRYAAVGERAGHRRDRNAGRLRNVLDRCTLHDL